MARVAVGLLVPISSWPRKIMFIEEGLIPLTPV